MPWKIAKKMLSFRNRFHSFEFHSFLRRERQPPQADGAAAAGRDPRAGAAAPQRRRLREPRYSRLRPRRRRGPRMTQGGVLSAEESRSGRRPTLEVATPTGRKRTNP